MVTRSGHQSPQDRFHRSKQVGFVVTGLLLAWGNLGQVVAADGAVPELAGFIARKETQARALATQLDLKVSEDVWSYFRTAQTGNVSSITNAFERLKKRSSQYEGSKDDATVGTPVWQTLIEVEVAIEAFADGEPKYSLAFGNGVIASIPPGSIYFGGTDAGRGLVTALSKSHADADPFFTITQNALADNRYLDYLRAMYGSKIRILTTNDSQRAFEDYLKDAQQRLATNQLKPGEDVRIDNGQVKVGGQVAVMAINGLLVKALFEANPDRAFYLEESFPLDWMYPHLSPHQLILKVNRKPLLELSDEMVRADRQFWIQQQAQLIGDWLRPETPVQEVCAFVQKVFNHNDRSAFKGDARFVQNDYATKLYSKLRSSIGGIYQWRATNAKSAAERERMTAEADFAFRQAFAFCPRSPEAMFRYVNLLAANTRINDALLVGMTAQVLDPGNSMLEKLVDDLRKHKRAQAK